ncbi:hypothetical protein WA026_012687 [Henosepilachna vigintioctopunctata]|uniref:Uncharacterized protein n=1 Tax=Henosepilachna vigintioctopunctata TaxID=420089 RepID=A0AAW1U8X8_9CUCU
MVMTQRASFPPTCYGTEPIPAAITSKPDYSPRVACLWNHVCKFIPSDSNITGDPEESDAETTFFKQTQLNRTTGSVV